MRAMPVAVRRRRHLTAERRFNLVQVFGPMLRAEGVEGAGRVVRPQPLRGQRRDPSVDLHRQAQGELGHVAGDHRPDESMGCPLIHSTSSGSTSPGPNGSPRPSLSASQRERASQKAR